MGRHELPIRWVWGVVVLGAAGVCLSGCTWKGGINPASRVNPSRQPLVIWQPTPVKIRVYPSTRFGREQGSPVLDARVELLDEMGDSTKGVGNMRLELFSQDHDGVPAVGALMYRWDVPVLTLADQRRYYDSITRAYRYRLKLDHEESTKVPAVLSVSFQPIEGIRLEAQAVLPSDAPFVESEVDTDN